MPKLRSGPSSRGTPPAIALIFRTLCSSLRLNAASEVCQLLLVIYRTQGQIIRLWSLPAIFQLGFEPLTRTPFLADDNLEASTSTSVPAGTVGSKFMK